MFTYNVLQLEIKVFIIYLYTELFLVNYKDEFQNLAWVTIITKTFIELNKWVPTLQLLHHKRWTELYWTYHDMILFTEEYFYVEVEHKPKTNTQLSLRNIYQEATHTIAKKKEN